MRGVDDQIAKEEIELANEVEMKLTVDKKIAHANAWRTHRETTKSLKKSRGKSTPCLASVLKCWSTR
jgi:hypothetical protein